MRAVLLARDSDPRVRTLHRGPQAGAQGRAILDRLRSRHRQEDVARSRVPHQLDSARRIRDDSRRRSRGDEEARGRQKGEGGGKEGRAGVEGDRGRGRGTRNEPRPRSGARVHPRRDSVRQVRRAPRQDRLHSQGRTGREGRHQEGRHRGFRRRQARRQLVRDAGRVPDRRRAGDRACPSRRGGRGADGRRRTARRAGCRTAIR